MWFVDCSCISFNVVSASITISIDAVPLRQAYFGRGSGDILLDNVVCRGTESSLLECTTNIIGQHNCDHSEDAGVRCEGDFLLKHTSKEFIQSFVYICFVLPTSTI